MNEPELYSMRYYAVLKYAEETCPSYSSFRFPAQLVPNPINEIATSSESKNCKEYVQIVPTSWTVLKDNEDGRTIESIPFTGRSEELSVKMIDEEIAGVKDDK